MTHRTPRRRSPPRRAARRPRVSTSRSNKQVDDAAAKQALPTLSDMPDSTWHVDISTFSDSTSTHDPPECGSIEFDSASTRDFEEAHRTVRESARFSQSDDDGDGIIAVYLESHDEPYPLTLFDEAGQSLDTCGEFSRTTDGSTVTNTASPLAPPLLGERTFGVRITSSSKAFHGRSALRAQRTQPHHRHAPDRRRGL